MNSHAREKDNRKVKLATNKEDGVEEDTGRE